MVQVVGVEGQVLYGAGEGQPGTPVKVGQLLNAGTFSASGNGILYLSTFAGSELRLAESGTLRFNGVEQPVERSTGHRSVFRLLAGKLRVTIRYQQSPPHSYRIELTRGSASVESGQCVICTHGDGTYVFVARGKTMMRGGAAAGVTTQPATSPAALAAASHPDGAAAERPILLRSNGSIGLLDQNGDVRVRPLSAVSAATQNCLLSGFNPDAAGGGSHNPVDSAGPIVSPIQ